MKTNVEEFVLAYEELKDHMKWKVTDKQILMMIASIYVLNQKPLQIERLLNLSEKIKQQASLFSPLRSYSRFTTAAVLDVNFDHPEEKIQELNDVYELFRKVKFSSGTFTYIAATILLTSGGNETSETIQKAKVIYDGMKKEHSFLTSSSDYPLATLLAIESQPDIISRIEVFYEELSRNGLRKGNDLQFLSHILALGKGIDNKVLMNRAIDIIDSFKHTPLKMKSMYYPIMGMLALLPAKEFSVDSIVSIYEELNKQKEFKWHKDMNFMVSASMFVNEKMGNNQLAEASLSTIVEAVLQAQQAVMIATIAAVSASSANSGN
ncbi:DUF4003 family protein [Paucisalibacillus globulus]|uniref:DUF4003 family protein n=1 Tax=Paucisalibacillus globulus TaxID=351095 RepID=UPI000420BDDD|nr:DUF4003 family protein [Paucisalibacillus globulus]